MGRPRNVDADIVVDRAMHAFWSHGYANTSPAQLAAATGVGKGSLYHAFGSKRGLFGEALARYDRLGAEFADEVLARPGTARDRIRALLIQMVDDDLAQPVRRGCLMANTTLELAGRDREIACLVQASQSRMIAALAGRIDQGRRDGDVRSDADPQACAEFVMNTIMGLRIMAKTADASTLYRVIDTALTTL